MGFVRPFLAGVALAIILVAFARAADAGGLDPPGPIGSTMRTLDDLLGAWNRQLPATGGCTSARFKCVLDDDAVLDRETGLVWERVPLATVHTWASATARCRNLVIAGRGGWRLPPVEELESLYDPSAATTVRLPTGHPFTVNLPVLWSATRNTVVDPASQSALRVDLRDGVIGLDLVTVGSISAWCVRGGAGYSGR
jgi:hypothetical protein